MKLILMLIGTLLVLLLVLANLKDHAMLRTQGAPRPAATQQQPAVIERAQADLEKARADAAARQRSAEE